VQASIFVSWKTQTTIKGQPLPKPVQLQTHRVDDPKIDKDGKTVTLAFRTWLALRKQPVPASDDALEREFEKKGILSNLT